MAAKKKLRSGMEDRLVPALVAQGCEYEPLFLRYPAPLRRYIPDVVTPNGIAIEIKGWFKPADRSKMLAVRAAYPDLDLRLVLATPNQKLAKKSSTTNAMWCDKYGFKWAAKVVPDSWLSEPVNEAALSILNAAPRHNKKAAPADPSQLELL